MLDEIKVCKLIKKTSDVRGCLVSKEETTHPTIFIAIDRVIVIRVTEYDKEVIAKLIKFGFMKPDYTFATTMNPIAELVSRTPTEEAKCTPFLYKVLSNKGKTTTLRFVENETEVGAYNDDCLACFREVNRYMENGKGKLVIKENGNTVGIIAPYRYDADRLAALAQKVAEYVRNK